MLYYRFQKFQNSKKYNGSKYNEKLFLDLPKTLKDVKLTYLI